MGRSFLYTQPGRQTGHRHIDSPSGNIMPPDDARTDAGEVTRLLHAVRDGDTEALDRLVPLIYDDLRALARRHLQRGAGERTMRPTALVHEAYVKLSGGGALQAGDRAHFLAIAARAMRQVLVDDARRHGADKRGGGWHRATLSDGSWVSDVAVDDLIALDDALATLEPRQRQVVECRFFGGMEDAEIAAALGVTDRTVRRDWVKARAWLYRALAERGR
jgi:RNA polymerase sigma factor (TIGR02999 family)